METNLLKTITRSACRAIALCALAGAPILASCGIDELEERIDQVENRLTELETSMQDQINGLKDLVDGKTTVASCKFDDIKKIWTIVLSDGKTINVAEDAIGGPKVGIAEVDGKKVWTLDGTPLVNAQGENLPVESVPDIRVNTETNEWEISADKGKTWLSTGIKAAEGMSIFSKVEEDESFVYFILSDGTRLKVAKDMASKVSVLSGKQYFAAGQTRTVKLELSNIDKVTVTKPDGWRASVDGDELLITAPAAENTYAETSGKVSVVAVGSDGKSSISEVYVEIGETPVAITIDLDGNIEFTLREDLANDWNFPGYSLGITPLDEFSPEALEKSLPDNDRRYDTYSNETFTVAGLLGREPEKGDCYVIWAIPFVDNYDGTYNFPAEDFVYESYISSFIGLEAKDITFEGATLVVTPKGVDSYYGSIVEAANFDPDSIIEEITGGYSSYETEYGVYNGPASDYAISWSPNALVPGETYTAFAIPSNRGAKTTKDDIYTVEFALPALKAGGNASVTIGDVTAELMSVTAECTPNSDVYRFFAAYYPDADYQQIAPENLPMELYSKGKKGVSEPVTVNRSGLTPDTKGWIIALAVDKDGNYNIIKKEANTTPIVFSDLTITGTPTGIDLDRATIELSGTSDIVKFRYRNFTASNWTTGYPFKGDWTATENNLVTSEFYPNTTVDATDGKVSVELTRLPGGTAHKFFVIGLDGDGKPTRMVCVDYEPNFPEGKYIKPGDAAWEANAAHRPVLSNFIVDGLPVSEMTELPFVDDPNKSDQHPLEADITVGEKCARYWIHAQQTGSYITSISDRGKTLEVINSPGTKVKEATGSKTKFMLNEWATGLRTFDLFIVWQDTDGNYYQYEALDLSSYLKK